MKTRTTNVTPYHVEASVNGEGFVLSFYCDGDKRINIHFKNWWIEYIARELWKVIAKQESALNDNKKALQQGASHE